MGRVYEYIQHNFKGALQSKILKQVIDSFDKVYLQNMPKLGHINLEKIYALWLKSRPSRSTFATLITDMNDLGWIDKREGTKRSAFELRIDAKAIRYALQMRPALNFKRTWLFAESVFDFDKIEIYRVKGVIEGSRMSKRWTMQEELNSFLYPE